MLTRDEIKVIIEGILSGTITKSRLPTALFYDIFEKFEGSLVESLIIHERPTPKLLDTYLKLSNNLRVFSASKVWQVINAVSKEISQKEMLLTFEKYYKTWGKTENDLVIKQSMSINDWQKYEEQKDIFPYLKYVTANDERVRDEHVRLNGIIKPVDSPFWNEFMPPLGYGCRCTVEQLEMAVPTKLLPNELQALRKETDMMFRNNPAKSGFIFKESGKDKHSYFKVPEKYQFAVDNLLR